MFVVDSANRRVQRFDPGGDVLVADPGNRRVQEFMSTGGFVRAFGWDTVTDDLGVTGSRSAFCLSAVIWRGCGVSCRFVLCGDGRASGLLGVEGGLLVGCRA